MPTLACGYCVKEMPLIGYGLASHILTGTTATSSTSNVWILNSNVTPQPATVFGQWDDSDAWDDSAVWYD